MSETVQIRKARGLGRPGGDHKSLLPASRRLRLLYSVLLLVILAIFGTWYIVWSSPLRRGNRALVAAFSRRRLIEARLSGGFRAAQFNPDRKDQADIDVAEWAKARSLISAAALDRDDAETHLAYGRLMLLDGDNKLAMKPLEDAAALMPNSGSPLNDLGVCLMEAGRLEDALDKFEAALKVAPGMPEALFNLALSYQRLQLRSEAAAQFGRLEKIERDPGWLTETKTRLASVSGPPRPPRPSTEVLAAFDSALANNQTEELKRIVDENFEVFRRRSLRELPTEYLRAAAAGDRAKADNLMSLIEVIGRSYLESRGDSIVVDEAAYLRTLTPIECQTELTIVLEYQEALGFYQAARYGDALPRLERLQAQFRSRGNLVLEEIAGSLVAACHYVANRYLACIAVLEGILPMVEAHEWLYDRARAYGQIGIAYVELGRDSMGIRQCKKALALCEKKPNGYKAKALQYISVAYWHLGDLDAAIAGLRESTRLHLERNPSPVELANNYLNIADIHRLRNKHRLALLYGEEALSFSDLAKESEGAAQAAAFVAIERAGVGEFDAAKQGIDRALQYVRELAEDRRGYAEPLTLTRAGDVSALQGDTAAALENFSKAEELARRSEGNRLPLLRVLRARGELYAASGRPEEARADLLGAVRLIEDQRAALEESQHRSEFLDLTQNVYDRAIALDVEALGRKEEAFELSERARARTLLDEIAVQSTTGSARANGDSALAGSTPSLSLRKIQDALPEDLTVIEYAVTDRGTFLFVITRSSLDVAKSDAAIEAIDRLVRDYLADLAIEAPIEEVRRKGAVLYSQLIGPAADPLRNRTRLCIVPDKTLHFLPLAALVDESGKYFIESHTLSYAPSASVLVRCLEVQRKKQAAAKERVLAVGNPEFDRQQWNELQPLPDAEREATLSAAAYGGDRVVLTRRDATEAHIRSAIQDCDVAHLAVHCLVEEKSPWLAALVLAPSLSQPSGGSGSRGSEGEYSGQPGRSSLDDGLLSLGEVYRMRLTRTRLVVLSACQSGLGQYFRGEGIVSLVHPFLAARVPTVVASLWQVDSRATAVLMIRFHSQRNEQRMGVDAALREAQTAMSRDATYGHPYFWASFIAIGAGQ